MRALGLDVGEKTIGVAVSDAMGWSAQGLGTIRRKTPDDDLARLKELIDEYQVTAIVVGLPLNMNGSRGPSAQRAQDLGDLIAVSLPDQQVVYQDERLTTVAAQRVLIEGNVSRKKRKQVIDKMAAVLILQGYLDRLNSSAD